MPQLRRLRFVNLGHGKSRMEDMTLEMYGVDGLATDTAVWLENGGGKSAMLALFFSVLRPAQREFLGAKSEQKLRQLEDYIGANDHGLVVAEWQLDDRDLLGFPRRVVTGVFMERGQSSGDKVQVDRTWFSFAVDEARPELTLEGTPVYEAGEPKRRYRRSGFKMRLSEIKANYPQAGVLMEETQGTWMRHLDDLGIDTELFLYQIQMNTREGGAGDIFRFRDVEEFVDFFIAMVMGEETGAELGRTLGTYRGELKRRHKEYLPESELVHGTIQKMSRLVEIRAERIKTLGDVRRTAGAARKLAEHLDSARLLRLDEVEEYGAEADRASGESARLSRAADVRHARVLVAAHLFAKMKTKAAEDNETRAAAEYNRLARNKEIIDLAVHRAREIRHRKQAEGYERSLEAARQEHAPLHADLRRAATELAGALDARVARLERRVAELSGREEAARRDAVALREAASEHASEASRQAERSRALRAEAKRADEDRSRLVSRGAIGSEEAVPHAEARWQRTRDEAEQERDVTRSNLETVTEEVRLREAQVRARADALAEAERSHRALAEALAAAQQERENLEADTLVLEALRTELLDLDQVEDAHLRRLAHAARTAQDERVEATQRVTRTNRILEKLGESGLLPPSADAERVVAYLAPRLTMVKSGWEYASEALSIASGAARRFIERQPALATGVVVRDEEFDLARELLAKADLELDWPLVVAPQAAVHADLPEERLLVLRPETDAHFDRAAADREREMHRENLDRLRAALMRMEARADALQRVAVRVEQFRAVYPRMHFRHTSERLAEMREDLERDREALGEVEEARGDAILRRDQMHARLGELGDVINRAERMRDLVQAHRNAYGADPEPRMRGLREAEAGAEDAREAEKTALEEAQELERVARSSGAEKDAMLGERGALESERRNLTDVEEEQVRLVEGDLDTLRDAHAILFARWRREVNEQGLEQMRRAALHEQAKAEHRYGNALKRILDSRGRQAQIFAGDNAETLAAEVSSHIGMTPDPDDLEQGREEVQTAAVSASGLEGAMKQATITAQEAEKLSLEAMRMLSSPPPDVSPGRDGVPASPAEAEVWLAEEGSEVDRLRSEAVKCESAAQEARGLATLSTAQATELTSQAEILRAILGGSEGRLARAGEAEAPEGWKAPETSEAIKGRIRDIKDALGRVSQEEDRLDGQRQKVHADLLSWMEREQFEDVTRSVPLYRNLRQHTAEHLEDASLTLTPQLELRAARLADALAAIDADRAKLIGMTLYEAEKGIQVLEAAQQMSRMPVGMPRFAGRHFLQVKHARPDAEASRNDRIAALIDEVIASESHPSGLELVQRAVRALGRPYQISVLFPDPVRGAWLTPIQHLGRDSGGEVLTSAIMLYCNLARLRARQRGTTAAPTTVLLLDNPIGTASRVSFLQVQLEVARAAGVQLVYLTGVKDYDAISLFPSINRLRPAGVDLKTRQWLLAVSEVVRPTGGLDTARLVRGAVDAPA
jgi:hypothetical protein